MNTMIQKFGCLLFVLTVVIVTVCTDSSHVDNYVGNGDSDSDKTPVAARFSKRLLPVVEKPAGNMVRLKCPAEGNPVPNITWYKDGKTPISRNLGTIRSARWSITLEDLVVSDTANYTCDVCNSMGCVNHTYKLEVLERVNHKPIFTETPMNQTVVYGHDCNFTCKYLSDLHSHVEWLVTYNNSQKTTTISNPTTPEVLQLHNVTFDDEGLYTCIASNSLGHTHASAYLKVVPCTCGKGQ